MNSNFVTLQLSKYLLLKTGMQINSREKSFHWEIEILN
jgi:hypothetical protein